MSLATRATACALLALPAAAQSFVKNATDIPSLVEYTEQVDFADVDLDGDWDAALATGGDQGPDQSRLWINQGYLQGGTVGVFLDATAARLPQVSDPTRDVEFADIDADADPDLYVVNNSALINSGARWWVNQGGEQGGPLGFYADETAARWVGLGQPGSSIPPALLLPSGSFIDWSSDGDFADLDSDGDLDLVHSSYGGAFGGNAPTRVFLNDGDGFFSEFNPSGFMLAGSSIATGNPALWCDGIQTKDTTDVTGAQADIAEAVVDFALGDTDGDFDVDIVLTGRSSPKPRFYRNHLETGGLSFRDESGLAFPGITLGNATFDQELGDLDDDGDLDLYGLNWSVTGFQYNDVTLTNAAGVFGSQTILPGSGSDEEEGDFIDYDNDGDLDLFVANFSGNELLYRNQGGAPITYVNVTATEMPAGGTSTVSHDVDVADVDGDGDYDAFVANSNGGKTEYFENVTQVADTTDPSLPGIDALSSAAAASGVRPVRASVFDNAGYYSIWYYEAALEVQVDGFSVPEAPMVSSRGGIFRGELPANLAGAVSYRARAADPYGNTGFSQVQGYVSTGDTGTLFGVESPPTGTAAPKVRALTEPRAGAPLYLAGQGIPFSPGFLGVSLAALAPTAVPGLPNMILNINPGAPLLVATSGVINGSGTLLVPLAVPPGTTGVTVYAQFLELAPNGTFGSSQGLALTIH